MLLAGNGRGEPLPATLATTREHVAARGRLHPCSEAVGALPLDIVGLIRPLHLNPPRATAQWAVSEIGSLV